MLTLRVVSPVAGLPHGSWSPVHCAGGPALKAVLGASPRGSGHSRVRARASHNLHVSGAGLEPQVSPCPLTSSLGVICATFSCSSSHATANLYLPSQPPASPSSPSSGTAGRVDRHRGEGAAVPHKANIMTPSSTDPPSCSILAPTKHQPHS